MNINAIHNARNPAQGNTKKVLCVCSAGLLRSPTAAVVLSQDPYNFNTRAVGVDTGHALIPITDTLVAWADEFVVMEYRHVYLLKMWGEETLTLGFKDKPIYVLGIPDNYTYRDTNLISLIRSRYDSRVRFEKEKVTTS